MGLGWEDGDPEEVARGDAVEGGERLGRGSGVFRKPGGGAGCFERCLAQGEGRPGKEPREQRDAEELEECC